MLGRPCHRRAGPCWGRTGNRARVSPLPPTNRVGEGHVAHCHWFVLILNLFVFLGILGLLRFSEFLEREIFFFWKSQKQKQVLLPFWNDACNNHHLNQYGTMQMMVEVGKWRWSVASIVHKKYVMNDLPSNVKGRIDDSPIWKDLLQVRHIYLKGGS